MRRSTRNTSALILDLVTLTPAGVPLPAYYARLRTLTLAGLLLVSTRLDSPSIALFPVPFARELPASCPRAARERLPPVLALWSLSIGPKSLQTYDFGGLRKGSSFIENSDLFVAPW